MNKPINLEPTVIGFDVVCHQCGRDRLHGLLIAVTPWWWRREAWFGRLLYGVRYNGRRLKLPASANLDLARAEEAEGEAAAKAHRLAHAGRYRRHWPVWDTKQAMMLPAVGGYAPYIDRGQDAAGARRV